MCGSAFAPPGEENAGAIISLCELEGCAEATIRNTLFTLTGAQEDEGDDDDRPMEKDSSKQGAGEPPPREVGPAARIAALFGSVARGAVVEYDYFDLDYRSQVSRMQEHSFEWFEGTTIRVHFFGRPPRAGAQEIGIRDYVKRVSTTYLGYVILLSRDPGTFGRSMVTADCHLPEDDPEREKLKPGALGDCVRTATGEPVQLFGIPLVARGVPFMEQDGRLLRCAHVSAWICHYTSVLRGFSVRQPSGQLHDAVDANESVGRPYPSDGLTIQGLNSLLRAIGLPCEIVDRDTLRRPSPPTLATELGLVSSSSKVRRAALKRHQETQGDWERIDAPRQRERLRANLVSTVARYLNSGLPIILARQDIGHTQVIVGRVRSTDYVGHDAKATSEVTDFLVVDDQKGPYVVVRVDDLVDEFVGAKTTARRSPPPTLVVPMLGNLWLPGDLAEWLAVDWLSGSIEQYANGELLEAPTEDPVASAVRKVMAHQLRDRILAGDQNGPALRTYVTASTDFKAAFADRCSDAVLVRAVTKLQLPRFLWITELIDDSIAEPGKVLAMTASDPTSTVRSWVGARSAQSSRAAPLFALLPGVFAARPDGHIRNPSAPLTWRWVEPVELDSGRRDHLRRNQTGYQHKAAVLPLR